MTEHFVIKGLVGKRTLSGVIVVRGAKNAALKGIAASLLYRTPISFTNVPEIEDVSRMVEIISGMGARVTTKKHELTIDATGSIFTTVTPEIAKRLRASIVLAGPMLARYGHVRFPHPGGCVIGERPIDLFIEGFEKMGATVKRVGKFYDIRSSKNGLRGAEIFFRSQSVTGTETFMMAAVLAKGKTVIKNAAMEPEIVWLADILNTSGAKISGAGTPTLMITGGRLLASKKAFRVIPDRIEAGSFLILGALAAKKLTVTDIVPEHLESLVELLEYTGTTVTRTKDSLTVSAGKGTKRLRAVNVRTHEYPGFPTDLQAPMMVYLTQAAGESLVFETIFEGRLNFTESLNRMGANITMMDPHRVLVKGSTKLHGRRLESPDLRAGLAFVIAALIAGGNSEIHNVYNIDRGYERIEERLRLIGVQIARKK
ncbi:MAG: UDP-N-acetylglucosamine 1-carboxyvinyltransferase [Candidatus Lloydbacteria bacterium RIFCSPHIGHO2_02_FULL_50_13]|uniref:UDP-N-acetylglucosamine 1-carboxyvinyltransferase n=1 Tax=Candidatus Lloydbacteria bacterium RIFCSPHIGHO2_02_FULL_50_13 TaxID=1798661 RepID=A0A1G2D2K2_9BACT|nr:MAG: UDP-N-acetylglucosamine 1-carboxyvinyltransferase [Candidatus Lloydbacteria bacterium RIFCSPHIGHO2_02_FULL_50_13]